MKERDEVLKMNMTFKGNRINFTCCGWLIDGVQCIRAIDVVKDIKRGLERATAAYNSLEYAYTHVELSEDDLYEVAHLMSQFKGDMQALTGLLKVWQPAADAELRETEAERAARGEWW